MELPNLLRDLARPAAFPEPVEQVEVRQTHVSAVFLAGWHAWKIKKPVRFGFLDFSTLERRRHFCEEEVRLNRRLAADVYLGVVPVVQSADGLRFEGPGEPVEWAVKMVRLDDERTLGALVDRGEADGVLMEKAARRVARFHAEAESGPRQAAQAGLEVVARNARENFEQTAAQVGITVTPEVHERLRARTEQGLDLLGPLIQARANAARDTHGDLRLDHVYVFPERPEPGDLVVIDCIEFNERFRFADPVADAAFLSMDLRRKGRPDLARAFAAAYLHASGDNEGGALFPFYTAYRAVVRAKVEGLAAAEQEVPEAQRLAARDRSAACWLLALGELEPPGRRPCLVMTSGLPGVGKSTLAGLLAARAGFHWIRSDLVRKELAGASGPAPFGQGIYSADWNDRTYAECLRRAEERLLRGERVLVDASFREECRRQTFLEMARRRCLPALLLVCRADADVVRRRLAERRGDASDADWAVHEQAARSWEPAAACWPVIDCNLPPEQAARAALAELEARHLQ